MSGLRVALSTLILLLAAHNVFAARTADEIVVQSAFVNVHDGVFELNARTTYPLNDDVRAALADGATINFELQAVVERQRRYWFNATQVEVTLRRELSWHAVSERYILRDIDGGAQQIFIALDEALIAAGVVTNWPVVVSPQLHRDATYKISVRAGIRRGRLPDALRALIWWSDSWNRNSEWYSWILPR
jgi:hypothetical protein